MNIRQLRYFLCVAEHLNFSKASKQLFITQPALSHQIMELERTLNTKLFIRDSKSVRLTYAGSILKDEGEKLIHLSDKIMEAISLADNGIRGGLNVGFLAAPVKRYFPKFISHFRKTYPLIQLNPTQYNMGPLNNALEDGTMDVGFTMSVDMIEGSNLLWKKIEHESIFEGLSFVMHKDYPLRCLGIPALSDVSDEPFIILAAKETPRLYALIMHACANRGFVPNIIEQATRMEEALILVDSGLGVGIVPSSAKNYEMSDLRFYEIPGEDTKIDIIVAWNKNNENPSLKLFLDEIDRWGDA